MKVSIESVIATLEEKNVAASIVTEIAQELQNLAEDAKGDSVPKIKTKNQFVVLVSDPDNKLKIDLPAWVVQIEDGVAPSDVINRVKDAAKAFSQTRSGRKHPVHTLGEALEIVPRKFYKTENPSVKTLIKTKTPVLVIKTDNKL